MNFKVTIQLSDGDEAQCRVAAENKEQAIERLQQTPQFVEFVGGREIANIAFAPAEDKPLRKGDYLLQKSEQKENGYVVTDAVNCIVIEFEQHRYNESQKITFLDDIQLSSLEIASILRKVGEWLARYHYFIAMPIEKNHRIIIGKKIREIRENHGLTQQELADRCHIDRSQIAKIEHGRFNFTIDTLYSIASALGKDVQLI